MKSSNGTIIDEKKLYLFKNILRTTKEVGNIQSQEEPEYDINIYQ